TIEFTHKGFESFCARHCYEALATGFSGHFFCEEFTPCSAEMLQPENPFGAKLFLKLPAQAGRQGRAASVGGNSDLQASSPYHCGIKKVAMFGIIDRVAQNPPLTASTEDGFVYGRTAGSGNNQKGPLHVSCRESTSAPDDQTGTRLLLDLAHRTRT